MAYRLPVFVNHYQIRRLLNQAAYTNTIFIFGRPAISSNPGTEFVWKFPLAIFLSSPPIQIQAKYLALSKKWHAANQSIIHDSTHPSEMTLPVIPSAPAA